MRTKSSWRIKAVVAGALLVSCIGCDQATKQLAVQMLQGTPRQSFFADTFRLEFALNPGGLLSLGSNLPEGARQAVFVGLNAVVMLGLSAYLLFKRQLPWLLFTSITLILAGGISNLIDRISNRGLVIDFLNLGIGPVRTGVFNVADIAVTAGAIGIAWLSFFPRERTIPVPK
jgi:signal peptidase II